MLTVEQIKTLINGLRQPIMNAIKQSQEAKSTSEQAQSVLSEKMDILNPVGVGSFSIGRKKGTTIGENSFAAGFFTEASGYGSHAEGNGSEATGTYSHVEGSLSRASGHSSHAEGQDCHAEGNCSHAEGSDTQALSYASHAEGFRTIAEGFASHVEGRSNIPSNEYLHIVGNGDNSGDRRSNAHTLDWKGNAWYQGDVLVGSTSGTDRDEGSVRLAKITEVIPNPTKAEVGQTLRVSAVDENGVPTAWEAAPSGKWRYIGRVTPEEDVISAALSVDSGGRPFSLSRVLIQGVIAPNTSDATGWIKPTINGHLWTIQSDLGACNPGEGVNGRGFRCELEVIAGRVFGRLPLGTMNDTNAYDLLYVVNHSGVDSLRSQIKITQINSIGLAGWQAGAIGAGSYFDIWGIDV